MSDKSFNFKLEECDARRIKYALNEMVDQNIDKDLFEKVLERFEEQYEKQR